MNQVTEKSLEEIGADVECDKVTVHHFGRYYETHFGPLRHRPIKLLEIGVGGEGTDLGGASIRLWLRYFSKAEIVAIDIYDKSALNGPRVTTVVCDQGNGAELDALVRAHGPFDVIIDDGSHIAEHVLTSLEALFPVLRPGGLYVIEDIQTSYWPTHKGSSLAIPIVETAAAWLKSSIDIINAAEIPNRAHKAVAARDRFPIDAVHVYPNIAILVKSATPDQPRRSTLPEPHLRNQLVMDQEAFSGISQSVAAYEQDLKVREDAFLRLSDGRGEGLAERVAKIAELASERGAYICELEQRKQAIEASLLAHSEAVKSYSRDSSNLKATIENRDAYIRQIEAQKSAIESSLRDHSEVVKSYAEVVSNLKGTIENRDSYIDRLESYKREIEGALTSHSDAIKSYSSVVSDLQNTVANRDAYIAQLEAYKKNIEAALQEHSAAISYYEKLTNPLGGI